MIQKIEKYAIVVPCYNEEKRFQLKIFFLSQKPTKM